MKPASQVTAAVHGAPGANSPHDVLCGHYFERVAEVDSNLGYLVRQRQQLAELRSTGERHALWQHFDELDGALPPRRALRPLLIPIVPNDSGVLLTLDERVAANDPGTGRDDGHLAEIAVAPRAGASLASDLVAPEPPSRAFVHKLKSRRHALDPVIDKAVSLADDPKDHHDVWNCLVRLARSSPPMAPLTGYQHGCVTFVGGELSKSNFVKRMKRRTAKHR